MSDQPADADRDDEGEQADPWTTVAELDVHPIGGGDVTIDDDADSADR